MAKTQVTEADKPKYERISRSLIYYFSQVNLQPHIKSWNLT